MIERVSVYQALCDGPECREKAEARVDTRRAFHRLLRDDGWGVQRPRHKGDRTKVHCPAHNDYDGG